MRRVLSEAPSGRLARLALLLTCALTAGGIGACGGSTEPSTPAVTPPPPPPPPPVPTVRTVVITTAERTLVPGESAAATAVARDSTGAPVASATVQWSTGSAAVATVSAAGSITGVAPGITTLVATSGSARAEQRLEVVAGGVVRPEGSVLSLLDGQLRLEVPAGAVSQPQAVRARVLTTPPTHPRLLAGSAVVVEPAIAFAGRPVLRLRYPSTLAPDVVPSQLRVAQLVSGTWIEDAVQPVDRDQRLVRTTATSTGTFALFTNPASLRSAAQQLGFPMGAAAWAPRLLSDPAYAALVAAEASSLTPENEMKFGLIHPEPTTYRFADADSLLAFTRTHGMQFYGHTLLWHSQQPAWLTAGTPTRASLLAALKSHIETVAGRYAGQLVGWDVANEMLADDGSGLRRSFWTDIVGPDVIDSAFVWTRRVDRTAKLYLNDYSVELINRKSDSLLALATRLKARGVPIDGVGLQAHLIIPSPNAQQLRANIARFQAAGFEVRITELDVRLSATQTLEAQAAAYGAVLEACLIAPRCAGLTIWGLSDRYSWIPGTFTGFGRALPFDDALQPKPAYRTLRDVLERSVRGP